MHRLKLTEKLKFTGNVALRVYDAFTGKLIPEECQNFPNIIVTNGYELLADVMIGAKTISYVGVGSGTTTPAAGDINLETPITSRKVITEASRTGAICLFSTFFNPMDCNGSWNESVLTTAESGDNTIISHALFTSTFAKDTTKQCYIDWTILIEGT